MKPTGRAAVATYSCSVEASLSSLACPVLLLRLFVMDATQQSLRDLWINARTGTLSAREQSRAWALREVWIDNNVTRKVARDKLTRKDLYGMLEFVRTRVFVAGKDATNPTTNSLKMLFTKIDDDVEWFPGKRDPNAAPPGPPPVLRGVKRNAVAQAAMALKRRGTEPTFADIVAQCPSAVINPATGEPVYPPRVYKVIGEDCYDNDPSYPWRNQPRVAKQCLTADAMTRRWNWGQDMLPLKQTGNWYYENIVWTDICNSVLARTRTKAAEQALARKGGRGWISDDSKYEPENMRGDTSSLKLGGSDTQRVYWAPILTRGKLHVEILPPGFPGDTEDGAEILVHKVRAALNVRFQNVTRPPRVLFVDRGNGFYVQTTGDITGKYASALKACGLKNYMSDNCGLQPGKLGDVLLHETAVAWIRRRERMTVPACAWEETREAFGTRIKSIVCDFNAKYDVESLCREFPDRMQKLVDGKGKKLRK